MSSSDIIHVFNALEQAGRPSGIGFYGAFAANSMRLEKGYRAWGSDLTTERTPLELGLGAFVKPGHDFIGRDALQTRESDGWQMLLLQLEPGEADPFHSHPVYHGDDVVGVVTSGGFGHRVGCALALALLREPGLTKGLSVEILGRRVAATVLDRPPFDPLNTRMKG